MSSVTATAAEIRHATRIARTETARGKLGAKGIWKVDLGIGGLSEERQAELAARINAAMGIDSKGEKVGDGFLHVRCISDCLGFHGTATFGLCEAERNLRQFGGIDYDAELLDAAMKFSLTPLSPEEAEEIETGQPQLSRGQKIAAKMLSKVLSSGAVNKLLHTSHGIGAAVTEETDRGMRQRHGDRSFVITGRIDGLDDDAETRLRAKALDAGLPQTAVHDGGFEMLVRVDHAGTGVGALLIMLRNLGDFFLLLPPSASLKVDVEPLVADDQG